MKKQHSLREVMMSNAYNYEKNTKHSYDKVKAESYKIDQVSGFSWIRFATWRVKYIIKNIISSLHIKEGDIIVDIPCGSGILGRILCSSQANIIASDISNHMMLLAKEDFEGEKFYGFVKADITQIPFKESLFNIVIALDLFHRLPIEIKWLALDAIKNVSKEYLIISDSVDSKIQKFKQLLLRLCIKSYIPAPSPINIHQLERETKNSGLIVVKKWHVMPFFSSKVMFLLKKHAH